jgi:hypothetical protein
VQLWQCLPQPIGLENRGQVCLVLAVKPGWTNWHLSQQFGVVPIRSGRPPDIQQVMVSGFGGKQSEKF